MIISIPSVIILTCLFISLWGGSIRFTTPMLFALAFLPMFGIGGLTGLPLGLQLQRHPPARHLLRHRPFPLHRRAGHHLRPVRRHLLLVPEVHRADDERVLGQGAFLAFAGLHEPDFPADVRSGHGGHAPAHGRWRRQLFRRRSMPEAIGRLERQRSCSLHTYILWAAWSWRWPRFRSSSISSGASGTGEPALGQPWEATTLEWQTPTPPPHGNFTEAPDVYRGPYEYSVPGHAADFHAAERTR